MRTVRTLLLLLAILVGAGVGEARAGDSPHDRATLLGLTAVFVDVQPLDPAGLLAGLNQVDVKNALETKLRLAGLRVITGPRDDVPPQERGVMQVNVSVVPVPKQDGAYGWSVYLALLQGAVLIRDMETILATPTWWVMKTGVGGIDEARAAVTDAADRFVTAFRAVASAATTTK